jgi:hypothetical protein
MHVLGRQSRLFLPLHPALREQPPRHGKEDGDEEMLDYAAVADGPVGFDTWILPTTRRNRTRSTGVYPEQGKITAEAMAID